MPETVDALEVISSSAAKVCTVLLPVAPPAFSYLMYKVFGFDASVFVANPITLAVIWLPLLADPVIVEPTKSER